MLSVASERRKRHMKIKALGEAGYGSSSISTTRKKVAGKVKQLRKKGYHKATRIGVFGMKPFGYT